MAEANATVRQVVRSFAHELQRMGIAAARILEPIQARGATPEEVVTHQISPFLDQVLREQAVVVA